MKAKLTYLNTDKIIKVNIKEINYSFGNIGLLFADRIGYQIIRPDDRINVEIVVDNAG